MTREELNRKAAEKIEAAIKAYEQEPCEDCISREDALMCLTGQYIADKEYPPEEIISKHIRRIKALPSVRPSVSENEDSISRNGLMKHLHECKVQNNGIIQAVVVAIESFVEQMPPVQPARRKGKWILAENGWNTICDYCGKGKWKGYIPAPEEAAEWMPICPQCCADMREED